jgi:ABC-type ATPase with predicted acetyltransferase domain
MLLTGPSGSGKSSLLRALRRHAKRAGVTTINLRRITFPERPIVDLFDRDATLEHTLRRLARVGLAEVWTWLRPPSQISEGQRWRLRLALAIERVERSASPALLVCDEFAAVLDRVTACIVSSVLRRAVDAHRDRLAALVATSHDDLGTALAADVTIECDFGRITIIRKDGAR